MKHGGVRRRWSEQDAIDGLRALAARLGHTPSAREMGTPTCPSSKYFVKHFGSLGRAVRKAGLPPSRTGRPRIHPHGQGSHVEMFLIDAAKAEAITRAKQQFWSQVEQGKHGLDWRHPYARRAS